MAPQHQEGRQGRASRWSRRARADEALAELKAFHDLYVHTAERDHFTPRPLSYFRTMVDALGAEEPDRIRLYLARHEGDLVAATIAIRVGGHAWYSYGASSTEKREVRGSNAVQWAMIRDALAAGADVYDLRGITDTLDADDSHVGLIQFKVGTGGEAVEYAGEWDLPINRPLYKAFEHLHDVDEDATMSLTLPSTATAGGATCARSPSQSALRASRPSPNCLPLATGTSPASGRRPTGSGVASVRRRR